MNKPLVWDPSQLVPPAGSLPKCPGCGTENPNIGFNLKGADLGLIGEVKFFLIYCASELKNQTETPDAPVKLCGRIFGVNLIQYDPPRDPAKMQQLMAALKNSGGSQA